MERGQMKISIAGRRLAAVIAGLLVAPLWAQDIEPRAYANAPVGTNFLLLGYARSEGGLAFDPSLPLSDPQLDVSTAVFAYARVVDVAGMEGKVDMVLPYSWLSGSALQNGEPVSREVEGLGDIRLRMGVNFWGAPALDTKAFSQYRQDLIVGASLQLTAPTGQYDGERLVNIGTNRWSLRPELGLSQALAQWTLELAGNVTFYGDNHDFYGGQERSQAPIYSLRSHVIYSFAPGVWASADATWFSGGRTTIDGVEGNDLQRNWRTGATLAFPISQQHALKLYASSGVSARTGNNYDLFGVIWQYRWL